MRRTTLRLRIAAALAAALTATAGLAAIGPADAQPASPVTFRFDGGGWGHGVGMSQWGAKGRADAGQSTTQILQAYYTGTQVTSRTLGTIRVHLASTPTTDIVLPAAAQWDVNGAGRAWSSAGDTVRVRSSGSTIVIQRVAPSAGSEFVLATAGEVATITLATGAPVRVGATGNRYNAGRLVFRVVNTQLQIVNDALTMQQYLYGLGEVPSSWPVAVLEAQAIAARTFAARKLQAPQSSNFDIYSTTIDQVYQGFEKQAAAQGARWVAAVDATDGQVVTYNGSLIEALYFSSSGGATENSENVFITALPYLKSVADPFDSAAPASLHRWSRTYTGTELAAWVRTSRGVDLGEVTAIEFGGPFGVSGRIDKAQITLSGTKANLILSGASFQGVINANAPGDRQLLSTLVFNRPLGNVDLTAFAPGGARVAGWTFFPGSDRLPSAQILVGGRVVATVTPDRVRPDVRSVLPGAPSVVGFDVVVPVAAATSEVCVNSLSGTVATPLGCRTVTVPTDPFGSFDVAANAGRGVRVAGWAADPQVTGPVPVHLYLNGGFAASVSTDRERPDVLVANPGYGPSRGFDAVLDAPPGTHDVCAYAINVGPGSHEFLGCRRVTVVPFDIAPPVGSLDVATGAGNSITVAGWTVDPDTSAPIPVHVYVDGAFVASATADGFRPDVAAAFPGRGDRHGYRTTVPASPGARSVCVFAINNGPGVNPLLGCRSVTVPAPDAAAPFGHVDVALNTLMGVRVEGWAIDPDTAEPVTIHVYVNGRFAATAPADRPRPDVGAALQQGDRRGYAIDILTNRFVPNDTCVYAINNNGVGPHTFLGCRRV
jgi:peptidoglycan hydrolase-like amidase